MATFQYKGQGLRAVGAYQVSGVPYITGSHANGLDQGKMQRYSFPNVTKAVTVVNTSATGSVYVHFQSGSFLRPFTEDGYEGELAFDVTEDVYLNRHYVTILPAAAWTFNVKCKEIYLSNSPTSDVDDLKFEIVAELTGIPIGSMYHLTGSGITS